MVTAKTYVDAKNGIENIYDNILYGDGQYIADLDAQLYSEIQTINNRRIKLNSIKYGEVEIRLYINEFFSLENLTKVMCDLQINADTIDEDTLYDMFQDDSTFNNALLYQIEQFCDDINDCIDSIKFPIGVNLTYYDGSLFMKINAENENQSVDWTNIQLDKSSIKVEDLGMNSEIL